MFDIPGQPRMGDVCPDWMIDLVRVIFGAQDPELGRQLVREFFISVAKKNGKSSFAAGVMLTALVMHTRHGEEFLILAPTKDVADNSFTPAYHMVKLDPPLLKVYKPSDTTREIINRLDGSILAVKSADAEVIGGQKATSVLVDELWLFGKKAAAKNILSEATGSHAARPDGFAMYITTQSDDPPAGVFREMLHYYREIRDGDRIDRQKLALIYEYPEAMQKAEAWRDQTTWHIPNPSLGRSVDASWIAGKLAEEEAKGTASLRLFLAKHFNIEAGIGFRTDGWPGAEYWDRRTDPTLTLDTLLARSEVVVIGVDGGGLDDLFGLCILGREPNENEVEITLPDGTKTKQRIKRWLAWTHAWCHKSVLERRKSIAAKLEDFRKSGHLTIVDDELFDVAEIVAIVERVKDAGLLGAVAADPAMLGEFVEALAAIEVTPENELLRGVGQGYRLMNAIKTAERRLASGMLVHSADPNAAWEVGNLKIEATATAIRATKANAGDAKIDVPMALFDAAEVMSLNPQPGAKSYRGIYSDAEAYAEAFGRQTDEGRDADWSPQVLADMKHPLFAEHKARFEAWQDRQHALEWSDA